MQGEESVDSGDSTTSSRRTQLGEYSTGFPLSDLLGLTSENLLSDQPFNLKINNHGVTFNHPLGTQIST